MVTTGNKLGTGDRFCIGGRVRSGFLTSFGVGVTNGGWTGDSRGFIECEGATVPDLIPMMPPGRRGPINPAGG